MYSLTHLRSCLQAVLFGVAWLVGTGPLSADQLVSQPYYPAIAKEAAVRLPGEHLNKTNLGDSISEKALENFLNALDPEHGIFLRDDVATFEEQSRLLDDQLRAGHLEFAFSLFSLYQQRVSERVAHVETLLENDFDITVSEEYEWKRDKAPWPENEAAQAELWRKKIKNEYVGAKVAEALRLKEAAEVAKAESDAVEASKDSEEEVESNPDTDAQASEGELAPPRPELKPKELISKRYRQFESVITGHDAEWVLQTYLTAFTHAYDAHSTYLSERTAEDFDIAMKLSLTGIGAILTLDDGAAKIVSLVAGGPASRDGRLKVGDRIIGVSQGDEPTQDIMFWPLYKSVRLIRGKVGTRVVLDVVPATDISNTRIERIELIRDVIQLEEKAAKAEVHEIPATENDQKFKLGVITLPDFYADQQGVKQGAEGARSSAFDVRNLLQELVSDNVDGILLDLRNNGGGSLRDAITMTGFFIEEGPIVQVRQGEYVMKYRDPSPKIEYEGPLVVLVNRLSASASEILAAALQDYGRAIIVGDTKTHGKGSVQTVFPLNPRDKRFGKLKVTTAGFYRINGDSTQLNGVTPDIKLRSAMDVMEIGEEFLPNVLPSSRVEPAFYDRSVHLRSLLDDLKTSSDRRTTSDPQYLAYQEQVDRLKDRQSVASISLNFEERMNIAEEEKALQEFQDGLLEAPSEAEYSDQDGAEKPRPDLIRDEALEILRDLLELQTPHQAS